MKTASKLPIPVPHPDQFTSRLRSPAVAARVGLWLGICFGICFLTGLISHYSQNVDQPIAFPTSPSWIYRVTQGLHVTTGTAAVPLLLVKLWAVYPRLFNRFPTGGVRKLAVDVVERVSISVLVASAIFMLVSGLPNAAQWYPWSDFSYRPTHYAVAWVAIGSLVVHIAVKLPLIRDALLDDVDDTTHDRETAVEESTISRRGLLRTTWLAAGAAVVLTVGSTLTPLRKVSIFAIASDEGPQGIPINRTAAAAQVEQIAIASNYRLDVVLGDRTVSLTREDLLAMAQHTETLPIACVEGWSASGDWSGVRLRDLLDLVEAPADSEVLVTSLEESGAFRQGLLQGNFADDDRTLLALGLNGEELDLDHGYPCRLIAPNRPGVRQTKWVKTLEVLA